MKHLIYTAIALMAVCAVGKAVEVPLVKLTGNIGIVDAAAFSPDGTKIVTAGERGRETLWRIGRQGQVVQIWNTTTGEKLQTLVGHPAVRFVAFSPDGKKIATASHNATVRIWDANSGEELQRLEGHRVSVRSAIFSSDGKKIVTTGDDRTIRIWDVDSGEELRKFEEYTNILCSAALSPDGSKIVAINTGDSLPRTNLCLWEATTQILDAESGEMLQELQGVNQVPSMAFSPDGKRIVTIVSVYKVEEGTHLFARANSTYAWWQSDSVRIWDVDTGKELQQLEGHTSRTYSTAFLPEGNKIVTVGFGAIQIWDAESGEELQKLEGPKLLLQRWIAISPDRKKIALEHNRVVRIWTLEE